jgi:DnaJ-class molecular chaperone
MADSFKDAYIMADSNDNRTSENEVKCCPVCSGSGVILTDFGDDYDDAECPECDGKGCVND